MLVRTEFRSNPDPCTPEDRGEHRAVPLEDLARRIREGRQEIEKLTRNALRIALDIGDALNDAQARVTEGGFGRWLRANCLMSQRSAELYQQLARHREEIEDKLAAAGELSIRAARKMIAKKPEGEPAETTPEPESETVDPVAATVTSLRSLTDVQLTAVWTAYELTALLRTMPPAWRVELARRVAGLRLDSKGREAALLRESEILRQALGPIRIAGMAGAASEHAKHAQEPALAGPPAPAPPVASLRIAPVTILQP